MSMMWSLLAILFGVTGSVAFYLASPNQKLFSRHVELKTGVFAGAMGFVASLLSFLQVAGPATSVYLLLTLVIFVWSVPPLLFGWWRYRKDRSS